MKPTAILLFLECSNVAFDFEKLYWNSTRRRKLCLMQILCFLLPPFVRPCLSTWYWVVKVNTPSIPQVANWLRIACRFSEWCNSSTSACLRRFFRMFWIARAKPVHIHGLNFNVNANVSGSNARRLCLLSIYWGQLRDFRCQILFDNVDMILLCLISNETLFANMPRVSSKILD